MDFHSQFTQIICCNTTITLTFRTHSLESFTTISCSVSFISDDQTVCKEQQLNRPIMRNSIHIRDLNRLFGFFIRDTKSTFEWKTIFSISSAFSGNSRNAQHSNARMMFTNRSDDGSLLTVMTSSEFTDTYKVSHFTLRYKAHKKIGRTENFNTIAKLRQKLFIQMNQMTHQLVHADQCSHFGYT